MSAPTARLPDSVPPVNSLHLDAPEAEAASASGRRRDSPAADPTGEQAGAMTWQGGSTADDPGDGTAAVMLDPADDDGRPNFPALRPKASARRDMRAVPVPVHRMAALKREWPRIFEPLVKQLGLQVRVRPARRTVLLRTSPRRDRKPPAAHAPEGALQRGEDFVRAFILGFDLADAIAFLRVDELFVETFEVKDVKSLRGDHLSRAVGRIAGKDGRTKFAIENATRSRIVLADSKIHILGSFQSIHMARESVVDLILGKQPGKVYGNLQKISRKLKERF